MNIFGLLLDWGRQAMQLTFQYRFIFKGEDFLEPTNEQCVQFHIRMGEYNEKIFITAPADPRNTIEMDSAELSIMTESQKDTFLEATKNIGKYCEGEDFHTDEERLRFAAKHMPDIFSKGSRYEKYSKFIVTR